MDVKYIRDSETVVIRDDGTHLRQLRALPQRRWEPAEQAWHVPLTRENLLAMRKAGFPIDGLNLPAAPSAYRVDRLPGKLAYVVRTMGTPTDIEACKKIPEQRRYEPGMRAWLCLASIANTEYLRKVFPQMEWSPQAEKTANGLTKPLGAISDAKADLVAKAVEVTADFKYPGKPRRHQITAFGLARRREAFALFMEQRTGKCYVQVCEVMDLYAAGKIKAWLVFCPNSVKDVWQEEIAKWMPEDLRRDVFIWRPENRGQVDKFLLPDPPGNERLKVLVMNAESLSTDKGIAAANMFLARYNALVTVDECTRFKSPSAQRTKTLIKLRTKARYRRIMSGTPITQGPLDAFAPFKFLGEHLLGFSSFYAFRNRYAVLGGFNGKVVVGYANLDELTSNIDKHSYRVLFKDCTDIKEPIYEKRYVELTEQQRRIYDEMKQKMKTELGGSQVSVQFAITKFLRLQQIVGGFLPVETDDGSGAGTTVNAKSVDSSNPKIDELMDVVEEFSGVKKIIIWARFHAEIALISRTLRQKYGDASVVEFHGNIPNDQRTRNRHAFQDETSPVRFFIGQPAAGGIGIPLYAADLTIFYSNDFSLETRLQAESRPLLPEKQLPHTYIDLVARNTLDVRLLGALRSKKGLADLVLQDPTMTWV